MLFAIVVLGSALGNLSQTAVNAMMADIMVGFGAGVEVGQWLTTSYMLVLGVTVPASTYLQRRFCVRVQVLLAFGLFIAGTALSLVAQGFAMLLAGRILQAVAAGILLPVMQTVAMTGFGPGKQATAMGIAGVALGFAPNIGPTIGGAMSFAWGWRSFFALMLALLAALALWTLVAVRRQPSPDSSARLDAVSLTQSTLGFGWRARLCGGRCCWACCSWCCSFAASGAWPTRWCPWVFSSVHSSPGDLSPSAC